MLPPLTLTPYRLPGAHASPAARRALFGPHLQGPVLGTPGPPGSPRPPAHQGGRGAPADGTARSSNAHPLKRCFSPPPLLAAVAAVAAAVAITTATSCTSQLLSEILRLTPTERAEQGRELNRFTTEGWCGAWLESRGLRPFGAPGAAPPPGARPKLGASSSRPSSFSGGSGSSGGSSGSSLPPMAAVVAAKSFAAELGGAEGYLPAFAELACCLVGASVASVMIAFPAAAHVAAARACLSLGSPPLRAPSSRSSCSGSTISPRSRRTRMDLGAAAGSEAGAPWEKMRRSA